MNQKRHYLALATMTALSFIAMYALMYAMVDRFDNVLNNLNQIYMAGLMAASMVLLEITLMRGMYPNQRLNLIVGSAALVALASFFILIRQQAAISDGQFLRSMIPHHASAILMCKRATINEDDIRRLCGSIIANQQAEINQMKAMLETR